ncbi:MAG: RNA polymerase sigma factor [Alistipes sp.]|nr:RNA polymerase sigma factor [Alistipes sp.]
MTVADYDRCVRQYSDNLYRFALKSLQQEEPAKDIVQESFLRLWENREVVIEGKEKSYLFTIAYRLIVDYVRLERRYGGNETLLNSRCASAGSEYNNLRETIDRYLEELPAQQKSLILLRDYEGYSYQEIAELTHLSESQVKVYIFRARVALKKRIGDLSNILG